MKHLSPQEILFLHHRLVEETGGSHGVRDIGLLESAIAASQQTFGGQPLYPTWWEQAAALMKNIIQNHPFIDGNKRTAVSVAAIMMELNGARLETTQQELVEFTLKVTEQKLPVEEVAAWLKIHAR